MLRSKYFWIALVIIVPFVFVWITEGLGWAIGMLLAVAFLFILIAGSTRKRRRRIYYYDDDEDEDEEIIVERRSRGPSPSSERIRDLYFPKGLRNIHQDGLNELGQKQRDDLKRTLRRLRR